jgi:hypothetical protein
MRTLRSLMMIALLIALGVPVHAQTLYGVADEFGRPSTLYTIDPATGTASPIGVVVDSSGSFFCCREISALAFHPTTGILYAISERGNNLIRIDPATAVATVIASISGPEIPDPLGGSFFPDRVSDIAFRADGVLFGFFPDSDFTQGSLATIDISTGVATLVGQTHSNPFFSLQILPDTQAIAFSPTGELRHGHSRTIDFGPIQGLLQTLSQTTGLVFGSVVAFSPLSFAPSEMEFQPGTGVLFASTLSGDLVTIDPATGVVTTVGTVVSGPVFQAIAFEFSPGINTPTGSLVPVSLPPVTLTFDSVIQAGNTTLATSTTGPPPPAGFTLGNPATYYDITTTALFSGTVLVCINYTGIAFDNEAALRLFHFEPTPLDVTVSLDTTTNIICGRVTSLSPFAILEPALEPTEAAKVTGGGMYAVPGGAATLGFNVQRKEEAGPVGGQYQYQNHATGENVHSETIDTLVVSDTDGDGKPDKAEFSGTCRKRQAGAETPCTFNVVVEDKGEPGRNDTHSINGVVIVPTSGKLDGGNIQIHKSS